MLDTTRSGSFVAGSNRLESASGIAWLALLPSQSPRRVLVLGVPSRSVLNALVRAAGSLTIRCGTARAARRVRARVSGASVTIETATSAPIETGFDLVVVGRGARRADLAEAERALGPDGALVVDGPRTADDGSRVLLRPVLGEPTAAVPAAAANVLAALERRGLRSRGVVVRAFGRSRVLTGRWLDALPDRTMGIGTAGPPAYLCRIAAAADIDVTGYDWAMAAPGRYRSNKILFFLFEPGADEPAYVVKITRDAELNRRLETERDALDALVRGSLVPQGTVPQPAFWGLEAGRAVLGCVALPGKPLTAVTLAAADCPHTARAFDWLTELGARTAAPGDGAELAKHLEEILARFLALYGLDAPLARFLEEQIALIGASPRPFPIVFQHGDPGAWNVLVGPDGSVAFLDWEAAEHGGVPLWDVFHLARSFAVLAGRAAGERDMVRGIDRFLFAPGPVNAMVGGVVRRYRERVGVPAGLVEPLFHSGWMHRALKEATRLPADRLAGGHYLALLRRSVERRTTEGFRTLLGEDGG